MSRHSPAWMQFAQAPLVPVAGAAAAGLCVDRYAHFPLGAELLLAAAALVGWFLTRTTHRAGLFLGLMVASLFAAHHQVQCRRIAEDDVSLLVPTEPKLVRLRGLLTTDPVTRFAPLDDPLEPRLKPDTDAAEFRVEAVATPAGWAEVSGRVRLSVEREAPQVSGAGPPLPLSGLRLGDRVEVFGLLTRPGPPRNPGERDYRQALADRGIRAELWVSASGAVTRLDADFGSWLGRLARLRRAASNLLAETLPKHQIGPAAALLLGDTQAMSRPEWDVYIRTGVVHVLAISGQHLAVLAGMLWVVARAANVRRAQAAAFVALVVVGYAVFTGLRPSGVRAAIMVLCVCGGLMLRRPVWPANTLALAALLVAALNPSDPFTLGFQFSFVSVFVLIFALGPWLTPRELTPVEQLIETARSPLERLIRGCGRIIRNAYFLTLVLVMVNAPLQLMNQNVVSVAGLVIGPVMVLLTSLALLSGFGLMLLAVVPGVGEGLAVIVRLLLGACEGVVQLADAWPGSAVFAPGPPLGWVIGFYLGVGVLVLGPQDWRRASLAGLLVWTLLALAVPRGSETAPDELRLTILAVGKGGCVVIETPDQRCLIYDLGTASGPAAIRHVVAPYLWHRGIHRVDELFISHGDFDHFNGIAELFRRFPVGQVTLTPSFADKPTREVAAALQVLQKAAVPVVVASAGDVRSAGEVRLEILHPPRTGPVGTENERSLVIRLTHAGHAVLLTGDLEKAGTQILLEQPARPAAVLVAPHHGSRPALPPALVAWCRPKLVGVSRGPALGNSIRSGDAHTAPIWDTHTHGAITIRSHTTGLIAETFLTGERLVVER